MGVQSTQSSQYIITVTHEGVHESLRVYNSSMGRITSGKLVVLIPLASQLSSRPLCHSEGGRSDRF